LYGERESFLKVFSHGFSDFEIEYPINKKSLNGPIKLCFGTICKNPLNAL
jgi:hypothetical protein